METAQCDENFLQGATLMKRATKYTGVQRALGNQWRPVTLNTADSAAISAPPRNPPAAPSNAQPPLLPHVHPPPPPQAEARRAAPTDPSPYTTQTVVGAL